MAILTEKKWEPTCLFNDTGNYMGPAAFESKEEAEQYLEKYNQKMILRLFGKDIRKHEGHIGNGGFNKMETLKLKVFKEDRIPSIGWVRTFKYAAQPGPEPESEPESEPEPGPHLSLSVSET